MKNKKKESKVAKKEENTGGKICGSVCVQNGDCPLSLTGMALFGCPAGYYEYEKERLDKESSEKAILEERYVDALRRIDMAKYWGKMPES